MNSFSLSPSRSPRLDQHALVSPARLQWSDACELVQADNSRHAAYPRSHVTTPFRRRHQCCLSIGGFKPQLFPISASATWATPASYGPAVWTLQTRIHQGPAGGYSRMYNHSPMPCEGADWTFYEILPCKIKALNDHKSYSEPWRGFQRTHTLWPFWIEKFFEIFPHAMRPFMGRMQIEPKESKEHLSVVHKETESNQQRFHSRIFIDHWVICIIFFIFKGKQSGEANIGEIGSLTWVLIESHMTD